MRDAARTPSGLSYVIGATGVAGIAAYATTIVLPRLIGGADYGLFAVFWAAMYLLVGSLGGIQQEVTRATGTLNSPSAGPSARVSRFGFSAAGIVAGSILLTAPLWQAVVFPQHGWQLVLPLAAGAGTYVIVATVCGSLYGVRAFGVAAVLLASDAVLRLVSVLITGIFTRDVPALAWAAAAPFIVTIIVFWPRIARSMAAGSGLDSGYRSLTWNVARTVVASAAASILVSGFPLILSLAAPREDVATLAGLYLAITLTRAPIIVIVMSLQSYLVVRFRDVPSRLVSTLSAVGLIIGMATVVLALLGLVLGTVVFGLLFPQIPSPPAGFFAVLVGSSGLVAGLYLTGSALLAMNDHLTYSSGWLFAAAVTVISLWLPFAVLDRVTLALIAGPVAGLVCHVVVITAKRRRLRTADGPASSRVDDQGRDR